MDIVFLIPQPPKIDLDWYDSSFKVGMEMVPLGVFYMATVLEKMGYNTEVIDMGTIHTTEEQDYQIDRIISEKPRLIGISTTTSTYPLGKEFARKFKKELNGYSKLIWGGYHVTFLPEEPLVEGIADVVVRGEGENAIREIARFFMENLGSLNSINGISYRTEGILVHNPPPVLRIGNLNQIPFPKRDFVKPKQYRNPGTLISSRGCIAQCQFCAAGAFGNIVLRSAANIVEEIKQLYRVYSFKHLFFVDNTFTTHKSRTLSIFQMLKENDIKINFSIESRVTQVDAEYIKQLSQNSLIAVQFGVETGDSEIMKSIGKKITLDQVERMVDICLTNGIIVTLSFIIGHPEDTRPTVFKTIKFAKEMVKRGAHATFGILTPFPGTPIFNNRQKLGIEIFDWDFSKWSVNKPVMRTKNLSQRELKVLMATASSEINAIC